MGEIESLEASTPDPLQPGDDLIFVNHYARQATGWTIATAAMVLGGLLLDGVAGMIVPLISGFVGGFFSLAFWHSSRHLAAELAALRGGAYLARWSIDRGQWEAWLTARKASWGGMSIGQGVAITACGLAVAAYAHFETGDGRWLALCAPLFGAAVAGVNLLHGPRRPAGLGSTVPLIVGPNGAVTAGAVFHWRDDIRSVVSAAVEPSPPCIEICYRQPSKRGHTIERVRLPVPPDRLDDAERVVGAIERSGLGDDRGEVKP